MARAAAVPPDSSDDTPATTASGTMLVPPNTMANPGTLHPGVLVALVHHGPAAVKVLARSVLTDDGNEVAPTGTRITGTASRAGRTKACAALVSCGTTPLVGVSARTGALRVAAALRAHHGPAANASAQPSPGCVGVPPVDAAMHTCEPATSAASPVAYHPPKRSAISTLVA